MVNLRVSPVLLERVMSQQTAGSVGHPLPSQLALRTCNLGICWTFFLGPGRPAPLTAKGAGAFLQHGVQLARPPPSGACPAAAQKPGWGYVPPGEGGLSPAPQGRRLLETMETHGEGTAVTHT